jgi:protein ImuA
MTARHDTLAALRDSLARMERGGMPSALPHFSFGIPAVDEALGGGLGQASLHEIFAANPSDGLATTGFGLALATRARLSRAGAGPVVWVRQRLLDSEFGLPHCHGLAAIGLYPARVLLVRVHDAADVLKAAHDAVQCAAVGVVLAEIWGEPKVLDLTASRRLSMAAADSGVTIFTTRIAADPEPSAATSRWQVSSASSRPLEADAPGAPVFSVTLLRHRAGLAPRNWRVEWDHDQCRFRDGSPLPRRLDAVPAGRKAAPPGDLQSTGEVVSLRRAG